MLTPQEILQKMITSSAKEAENIQISINQIQAMIEEFQLKQEIIKTTIGDVIISEFETYLQTKFTPFTQYYQYKGTTYNQILTIHGSFIDWKIYKILNLINITYISPSVFECDEDHTAIFNKDCSVSFLLNNIRVYNTVSSSFYSDNKTTIILEDANLNSALSTVWLLHYTHSPSDDTTIDEYKSNWEFAHDYITHPLDASGTYGIQDNIAKLTSAKNLLQSNKDKLTNSVSIFQNF